MHEALLPAEARKVQGSSWFQQTVADQFLLGRLKLPRRWLWLMHRRYELVQPRRRVSTKPKGGPGEKSSKARIAF